MNKKLITIVVGAGLALSAAACGQAAAQSSSQQPSVSTSVTPDDSPSPANSPANSPKGPTNGSTGGSADAISRDRAIQIALGRTGGGDVDEVENEFEHGRTAWKVRIVKNGIRYSVYIAKATGDIIRFRDEGRD